MPSVIPIDPQSITDIINEEEIPFKESPSENVSCSREDFNSLNSSTYYYLYPYLFNDFILQESTHCSIQMNSIRLTHFDILDGEMYIWNIERIRPLPMN
jgi:hypothetical protein